MFTHLKNKYNYAYENIFISNFSYFYSFLCISIGMV